MVVNVPQIWILRPRCDFCFRDIPVLPTFSGRFLFLTDVSEATTERDDTTITNDTVSAELTQESTFDLPADETTPEENVRILRISMIVSYRLSTYLSVQKRF